jgi:DNA-binding IclR family transcriptional regulator
LALGARGPFPARQSSIGRVLLAQLNEEELASFCELDTECAEGLGEVLQGVRDRGYARGGIKGESLAVAVGQPAIAALAVAGNIDPKDEADLAQRLKVAAARIDHT